jgi:hypothetical protein
MFMFFSPVRDDRIDSSIEFLEHIKPRDRMNRSFVPRALSLPSTRFPVLNRRAIVKKSLRAVDQIVLLERRRDDGAL